MSLSQKSQKQQLFDDTYLILSTLGRGQNAVVYKAKNNNETEEEKFVALKAVFKNLHTREALQRLKREALSLLATRHNNVIRMYDYKTSAEYCYLALEYAGNGSLHNLLERSPEGLPWQQTINIMKQVLAGLSSIHRAGIVHRDIKPENLLLTNLGVVKIADFSLACFPHEEDRVEKEPQATGTFEYLAPEILQDSEASARSDIYAAGVTFFRLLTGEFPFPDDSIASHAQAKIHGRHFHLADFVDVPSVGFDLIINQALAPHPQARYQSAEQFLAELEKLERVLFGEDAPSVLTVDAVTTRKVARRPYTASDENRFLEQHTFFRNFQNDIEAGNTSLVAVEASNVGPLAPVLEFSYDLFERYLSSTTRRIAFMGVVFCLLIGTYKIVSRNGVNGGNAAVASDTIWLTKADRVLQALQPFLADDIHLGVVNNLSAPENDDAIYFRKGENETYIFGVGLPGWTESRYTYEELAEIRELQVSGEAGELVFRIEGKSQDQLHVWGTYSLNDAPSRGRWILW